MSKKEEYAIAVVILIALVVAAVSIWYSSNILALGAVALAIIAVLYAIYVIHAEISEAELQQSYERGYQDHAKGKLKSNVTPAYKDDDALYPTGMTSESDDAYEAESAEADTTDTEKDNTYTYSNSENKGTYTYPDSESKNTTRKPHAVEDEELYEGNDDQKEKRPARGKRSHVKGYLRRKALTPEDQDSNE